MKFLLQLEATLFRVCGRNYVLIFIYHQSKLIMNIRLFFFAVTTLASFAASTSTSFAAGDIVKGEALSQTCMGCHGVPGLRNASPVYRVPMIGGQHASYLENALKAYRNKERSHPTMRAQAASLTDQDITDISAYFESFKQETTPFVKAGANAGKEKAANCVACHGLEGKADTDTAKSAGFPRLAGQYDDYLERVLLDYKTGARKNAIMQGQVATLSKKDIRNLARWFRSQKGTLNAPVISSKK